MARLFVHRHLAQCPAPSRYPRNEYGLWFPQPSRGGSKPGPEWPSGRTRIWDREAALPLTLKAVCVGRVLCLPSLAMAHGDMDVILIASHHTNSRAGLAPGNLCRATPIWPWPGEDIGHGGSSQTDQVPFWIFSLAAWHSLGKLLCLSEPPGPASEVEAKDSSLTGQ